ncbi:MAG: type I phosphomannose isomerase catalytic subunit [Spirochaetota bacterium]
MQGILRFQPIYKETIWGGRKLESIYQRNIPTGKIGESWEISDYGQDLSIITNGVLAGKSFRECYKQYKQDILGTMFADTKRFPLLVKIIDADDWLSVQVHPDDAYTQKYAPKKFGKKETWYVLQTDANAQIICGFEEETDKELYRQKILDNKAEIGLKHFLPNPGDLFMIEPGTIHAIGKGNLLLEVQQSSDCTYRVYDYGRKDKEGNLRELHIDRALEVLNFSNKNDVTPKAKKIAFPHGERVVLTHNDKYRMDLFTVSSSFTSQQVSPVRTFQIVSIVEGTLEVTCEQEVEKFQTGDSFLISAYGSDKVTLVPQVTRTRLVVTLPGLDWLA